MAGLRSVFSKPRRKDGATTQNWGVAEHAVFSTPEVNVNVAYDGFARRMPHRNFPSHQVHSNSTSGSLTSANSSNVVNSDGGGRHNAHQNERNYLVNKGSLSQAPDPCYTLKARLSLESNRN